MEYCEVNAALGRYCTAALGRYCTAALGRYCTAALGRYCIAALGRYCTAALGCYCTAALGRYCTAARECGWGLGDSSMCQYSTQYTKGDLHAYAAAQQTLHSIYVNRCVCTAAV